MGIPGGGGANPRVGGWGILSGGPGWGLEPLAAIAEVAAQMEREEEEAGVGTSGSGGGWGWVAQMEKRAAEEAAAVGGSGMSQREGMERDDSFKAELRIADAGMYSGEEEEEEGGEELETLDSERAEREEGEEVMQGEGRGYATQGRGQPLLASALSDDRRIQHQLQELLTGAALLQHSATAGLRYSRDAQVLRTASSTGFAAPSVDAAAGEDKLLAVSDFAGVRRRKV